MNYGFKKELEIGFDEAVDKVKQSLKDEGFGILTEANIQEALKAKLGVDYDKYLILGACHPPSAYKVLQAEKDIGLLLPCNVIIYEDNGKTIVNAINPIVAMSIVENESLGDIAQEITEKLKKVIDNLDNIKGDN